MGELKKADMEDAVFEEFINEDGDIIRRKKKLQAKDVEITRKGTQIVIPKTMSLEEAERWIRRKKKEDDREVRLDEVIEGYPIDAAYALTKAMAEKYGWTNMVPTPGFWGSENPPVMIGVQTGLGKDDTIQVPWGRFQVPGIDGYLESGVVIRDKKPCFCIDGVIKHKNLEEIRQLACRTRELLRIDSIYRGKAFRIEFPDDPKEFDLRDCPKFMDTNKIAPNELIFSDDLNTAIWDNLFTPIVYTDVCRERNVPLKRGILLEGPYGTGKTMAAYVTAALCEQNGWTFIYLAKTTDLSQAIYFAKQYSPAVIFAEDIDSVMKGNERDKTINDLLNTIDGVTTKGSELMVVLTTNHVERVNQAMIRPGRLDAVLSIQPPDAPAVERLIRLYGGNIIAKDEDLVSAAKRLDGQIPAIIREVVEKAKLSAIRRTEGKEFMLTGPDLDHAAKSMLGHLELLKPKPEDKRTENEKAAKVLVDGFVKIAKMQSNGKSNGEMSITPSEEEPAKQLTSPPSA